jgi:LAS superfamily LD-carboxypeptidase LdcB
MNRKTVISSQQSMRFRFHITIVLVAVVGFGVGKQHSKLNTQHSSVGNQQSVISIQRSANKSTSKFSEAAKRNAVLRNELTWELGRKPQRGWYLYTALINRLLKIDERAVGNQQPANSNWKSENSNERFANALAKWQRKAGLEPNGVLDDATLYKIIAEWQERRLKDRTPAEPKQLVTAPASDFYDPERRDELRQVERKTYAAYKRMVAAAVADPSLGLKSAGKDQLAPAEKYLKIISSFRTREYQEQLRRESPTAGSAGLAVNSPHFTGRALDLYVGGEPVETNDKNRAIQVNTRVYLWLVRNAERFGFRPYFYEPWHWEYVK